MQLLIKIFILTILSCFFGQISQAQGYPAQEFRSPLGIPIILAGTFGELRTNHFHAGLDIKTNGGSGYKIYAIADGYVSRIKVQAGGYGKAIYINHPNGKTSVYAHLSVLKDEIGEYVESKQYENQSFEVDLYPTAGTLPVTKSQVIALSGNTGSSSAPHLHFEIRDTHTEHPLNPLKYFDVPDSKAPTLTQAGIVAFNAQGLMSDNTIYYKKNETPSVIKVSQPRIGISLHAHDLLDGASNENGVYSIKMFDNGNLVYEYRMDEFSFDETRYMNSHIHYPAYCEFRRREHRCYREPANKLNNYNTIIDNGIIDLYDGQVHTLTFEIADIKNNITRHKMKVQLDEMGGRLFDFPLPTAYSADWGVPYTIESQDFIFETDQASLYNALYMNYQAEYDNIGSNFSGKHSIGPSCYAFHKPCKVKIKPFNYNANNQQKLIIAVETDKGNIIGLTSLWEGEYLTATTKTPGTFYVTSDFEQPKISAIKTYSKGTFKNGDKFVFKISDNLSGIKNYNAYINGNWVLLDYDAKTAKITHELDNRTPSGLHDCLIIVEDGCGNTQKLQFSFTKR